MDVIEADLDSAEDEESTVDFAFVAWRDEEAWHAVAVPSDRTEQLDSIESFARHRQGESGSLAFVSVADEFFILLRIQGRRTRVLLSDVSAILDWPLAEDVADLLHLDLDDDDLDDLPEGEPAGDPTLLTDHGISPADLELLCADLELYPDEQIASLAARIGFGDQFGQIVDMVHV